MWEMLRCAWTGMQLKCPACKTGHVYRSFTQMHHACPACGVVFEREEGDFVGAMVVAYSITSVFIAVGVYAVEVLTDLDPMLHILLWGLVATAFLIGTYRNMKGIWLGILHVMVGLRTP
ncbi:MAG TPA: DUF983 domain-containing protein [Symbiobacteriaceae bacterium]|nr:DUF983 domain-containing protein [Symbiobacteriaceae bacterium]